MSFQKTTAVILAAVLFTGMAAADTPDIPAPGITPESPFYILEKASERLELAVAQAPVIGSEELEAKVRANHAAETLAEARVMAEKNNTAQVEKLMNRYSDNMNRSMESASTSNKTELKQRLRNVTNNQNSALAELEKKVPEQARKGIQKAIENNRNNQEKLGKPPTATPAGQEPGKPENPGQERDKAPTRGENPPITGRSTSPENPSTEPSSEKPENTGGRNKPKSDSSAPETRGKSIDNSESGSSTEERSSETADKTGNSHRP